MILLTADHIEDSHRQTVTEKVMVYDSSGPRNTHFQRKCCTRGILTLTLIGGTTAAGKTASSEFVRPIIFTSSKSEFTGSTTVRTWPVCIVCRLRNNFASMSNCGRLAVGLNCFICLGQPGQI